MANVKVPYPEPGLAAFEQLDDYTAGFLLSGAHPPFVVGYPMPVPADAEYSQFQVLGLDANGALVPAVKGTVQASFVCSQAIKGNSDGTTRVPALYSGCFNPEALVWDDSYATLEDKKAAFIGAPAPTQITILERL